MVITTKTVTKMAAASGSHILDANSAVATCSELNLFELPLTQIAINSSFWHVIQPKNNLDNRGPWSFELNTGPHYAQLRKNYLYLKLKLVRTDGGQVRNINIAAGQGDTVGPVNMLASTFFKTVKLYIGGKLVSDSNDLYGYRVILETELNHSKATKEGSHLQAALYSQDRPHNHMNDANNLGWQERRTWFNGSADVEMMVPIRCDLFNSPKLIPTNTSIAIQLVRQDDDFILMNYNAAPAAGVAARTYEYRLTEMKWFVHMLDISKSAHLAIEHTLLNFPAKYPIRRVQLVRISVEQNADRIPNHTLFQGQIPRRIIFGCVHRDAFNGNDENPFLFQPFGIQEATLTAGGVTYFRDPLKTDFANNIYLRAYLQLLDSIGMGSGDENCGIDPKTYKAGMTLFAFDLTPDKQDSGHWDLIRQGSTVLNAKFNPALPHAIEIVVYVEFDSVIRIDHNREAHLNYMV